MENIIIIAVVLVIIGLAAGYVYRTKKKGKTVCIGCPHGGCCSASKTCVCREICHTSDE